MRYLILHIRSRQEACNALTVKKKLLESEFSRLTEVCSQDHALIVNTALDLCDISRDIEHNFCNKQYDRINLRANEQSWPLAI